jgi:hypothetical protein
MLHLKARRILQEMPDLNIVKCLFFYFVMCENVCDEKVYCICYLHPVIC